MSKEALAKVVQRAISDASFRRQLSSDTAGALRGFDLTADEVSALRAGDAGRLSTLGVDQRMSKSFALGGALAATKMAQSDLTTGNPSMIDDVSGAGSRTVIPSDPDATLTADDAGGGAATKSAIRDDPDGFLAAQAKVSGGAASVRTGDDWKFADRPSSGTESVRTGDDWKFADKASGGGMENYPPHSGLAGPSQLDSARAGDDWARSARIDDAARAGTARLDDAGGVSGGPRAIRDDPDGLLASQAQAEATGGSAATSDAFVDDSKDPAYQSVNDDPDGLLGSKAQAVATGGSVATSDAYGTAFVDDSKDPAYQSVNDDPDGLLGSKAQAVATGGSAATSDAFVDESSEGYLTTVGYDPEAASPKAKATWSGDENAGPTSVPDDDGGASPAEGGPNITP